MEVLANTLVVIILKIQVYQINKYTLNLHSVVCQYISIKRNQFFKKTAMKQNRLDDIIQMVNTQLL